MTQPGFPLEKLDPKIGSLKAYYKEWSLDQEEYLDKENESYATFTEITLVPCTQERLGLDPPKPEVNSPDDNSEPATNENGNESENTNTDDPTPTEEDPAEASEGTSAEDSA